MKVSPSIARNHKVMSTNVYTHVNWLLAFRHSADRVDFDEFKISSTQKRMFIIAHLCACYYFLKSALSVSRHYPSVLSTVFLVVVMVVNLFIGTTMVLYKFRDFYCRDLVIPAAVKSCLKLCESAWMVGVNVCYSLLIVLIGYNGRCHSVMVSGCNYSGTDGKMPEDIVFAAIVMPIFVAMAVKGATWASVLTAYAFTLFAILFTVLYFDMQIWWSSFIVFAFASLLVLYDHQRQLIALYLLTRSKDGLLSELEKYGEELNAKELRSMIANVAHDLKTPMAAIVNGLEYCMSTLSELASQTGEPKKIISGIQALLGSVQNMRNVNHFMTMSINRCIDYSKASNGVVLLPHMETVKLSDLLFLPIDCMRNLMEGKIGFELQPIAYEIATHIITDKQWLQENVLCLLSNAGKYSSEGTVKISLSLHSAHELQHKHATVSITSEHAVFLRFDVEDTGIGISDEVKAGLFTPFKQAQRLAGGTGLGLYSLAKRVEALKGYYGVQNRRDGKQGSNFWFAIPYRPDDSISGDWSKSGTKSLAMVDPVILYDREEDSPDVRARGSSVNFVGSPNHSFRRTVPAQTPHTASPSPLSPVTSPRTEPADVSGGGSGGSLRILLVDDSMSILKITGMMLRKLGHSVTTAENGAIALKTLGLDGSKDWDELPVFDVVLMDLQMPVMDGLEATKRIRAFERGESSYKLRNKPGGLREASYRDLLTTTVQQIALDTGRHQMILGVSACSDAETIQAAYTAGIDGFISKPFSKESFNESYLRCKTTIDSLITDKLLDIV